MTRRVRRPSVCSVIALVVASACGGAAPPSTGDLATELRCSEAPEVSASGVATLRGCAFEQQTYNVRTHGHALARPAALRDASGLELGTATHACGEWLLGADPSGTTVVINRETGELRSHGRLHVGQVSSALPDAIALPLELR